MFCKKVKLEIEAVVIKLVVEAVVINASGSSSYCRILNWSIISRTTRSKCYGRNRSMLVIGIVVEVTVIV